MNVDGVEGKEDNDGQVYLKIKLQLNDVAE